MGIGGLPVEYDGVEEMRVYMGKSNESEVMNIYYQTVP